MNSARLFALATFLVLAGLLGRGEGSGELAAGDPLAASNVVWTSPSTNSSGSMPLGNGDLGLNLWVEQDGDLRLYIGKTDTWDEQARLLKLGRVRVTLSPNPFKKGLPFRQELHLRDGQVQIDAGPAESPVTLRIWVDANRPVVRVEARGKNPFDLHAKLELWRTQERALVGGEENGTDTPASDLAPVVHPDVVADKQRDRVVWFHRNESSIWPATLKHQGLESLRTRLSDPLLNRTFGGLMKGDGLVSQDATQLRSSSPAREFNLAIYALTAQTDSASAWLTELERVIETAGQIQPEESWRAHRAWWNAFWDRSWIRVTGSPVTPSTARAVVHAQLPPRIDADSGDGVSQGYARQRFINACGGRGQFPIKFNGSIFTVDPPGTFDPDYRMWGGSYWFQNTRLSYWPMLAAGDFDLMQPLFKMYRAMLPLAKARTLIYFQHGGAFFPETFHFWGTYHNGEFGYGWKRETEPFGRPMNRYIRFYWSGGLELTAMMLDYYALTQDEDFLKTSLLPLAEPIVEFYDQHYPRGAKGRLLIVPAQSLETWGQSDNPMPDLAGLRSVLEHLLALPPGPITPEQRARWERLRGSLPELPTRVISGQTVLAPGESFSNQQNMENPELYAIFPYRLFGVGKPDLELAKRTFEFRQFKGNRGWQQDDTQMAFLGLASQARDYVVNRFAVKHVGSRFPAFWGPNFDWVPDQDHGGNGLMALQTMLLQWDGKKMFLFPAWPKDWDVEFKLHAPFQTTVEGVYRDGKLLRLRVTPIERQTDLVKLQPQSASHKSACP